MANWQGGFDRSFSAAEFKEHVAALKWDKWKPSFVVIHNTGAPNLAQWRATPGGEKQRLKNLEHYYKNQRGWPSGPHVFIGDLIWQGTPLTVPGTHTPSWNKISLGVEIAGDYDKDVLGGVIKENTIAALAILHEALGLDPSTMRLHKEDKATTHDCPGKNINKADLIAAVKAKMVTGAVAPKIEPQAPSSDYIAKPGDTLWGLAKKFAKAVADLIAWNGPALKAGQKVNLSAPANKLSHDGACFIAREEGVVLTVYMDGSIPAVGMGHNDARLKLGDTITLEEALRLFEQDIQKFTAGVLKVLTKPCAQHELDSLVSIAYNIGLGNFSRSSIVANFNSGDKAKAADSFLLWHKASGKADVLLGRRQRERTLFLTSSYGKIDTVPVWTGDPRTTKAVKMALPK
jgi:GH24 family phage-related lysozyme (muramidase)